MQGFADNFISVIPYEDDPLHSDDNPFCYDQSCPCHEQNSEAITVAHQAVLNGTLTEKEATEYVLGHLL